MNKRMAYRWRLREVMAGKGVYLTAKLQPVLAKYGIDLSREQVYRIVMKPPQRVRLDVLAALCDIFSCGVDDLIEVYAASDEDLEN